MKLSIRYIMFCLFTLSSALCRAENVSVEHDFNAMYNAVPRQLSVTNSNHTGTTDFCTYTCSGGAEFLSNITKTGGLLAIFLETNSYHFVTTSKIQNIDSLRIEYRPDEAKKRMTISISEDSISWTNMTVKDGVGGVKTIKMPRAGDYFVRFTRKDDVYITKIKYIYVDLSGCPNCFLYKP